MVVADLLVLMCSVLVIRELSRSYLGQYDSQGTNRARYKIRAMVATKSTADKLERTMSHPLSRDRTPTTPHAHTNLYQ